MHHLCHKKKWNWVAFFFAPFYYSGYGKLSQGLLFSVITAFPFLGLLTALYSGCNANIDLPVGKAEFNWKNVLITVGVFILMIVIFAIDAIDLKGHLI